MNLNDTRELLWLTGGLYGTALIFGLFKTFKVKSFFREIPLIFISLGFVIHTRALYLRGLMCMVARLAIHLSVLNLSFGR